MNIKPANQHDLPWVVRERVHHGHVSTIHDTHGNMGFLKVYNDKHKQTANFVKVACNSHHDLVKALETVLDAIERPASVNSDWAYSTAKNALAKAKG